MIQFFFSNKDFSQTIKSIEREREGETRFFFLPVYIDDNKGRVGEGHEEEEESALKHAGSRGGGGGG